MTQTADNHAGNAPRSTPSPVPAPVPSPHLALGRFGETYAAGRLVAGGMVLLERNWTGARGEVDLLLREGRTLVLCEVKTRTGQGHGHPIEAVDEAKAARLHALAEEWIEARGVTPSEVRFDVAAVLVEAGAVSSFEHVRGIG